MSDVHVFQLIKQFLQQLDGSLLPGVSFVEPFVAAI